MKVRMVIVLTLTVALLTLSCEQVIRSVLDIEAPTSVNASDGGYTDRIEVSWNGVSDTAADGTPRTVDSYEVHRTPSWSATNPRTTTETSYVDSDLSAGTSYSYQIRAVFTDGTFSSYSFADTGYAMNSRTSQLYSSEGAGALAYSASSATWFTFLGQKGWRYGITLSGSNAGATTVTLYYESSIVTAIAPTSSAGDTDYYTAPRSGLYHIKLEGGSGTISVSY